jgi:hypothetical protein
MRTSAGKVIAVGALLGAVVLWGSALPGVVLAQSEAPASPAATEGAIPTMPPLPTEAVPIPCETAPIPPETAPSEAAPSETPSFAESTVTPIATEAVPVESPTGSGPCESAAPGESSIPGETPGSSESASQFCVLLTSDEIQSVIGSPVIDGSGDATSCGWASADPNSATLIIVQDLSLSDFDDLKATSVPGLTNTPVSGVGDDAFTQTLADTVTTLYMKKGDRAIQVMVVDSNASASDIVTMETKLAQIIAGKI